MPFGDAPLSQTLSRIPAQSPKEILEILTNREVVAIDQDTAGHQATRLSKNGDVEVWVKKLADGGQAVGLFNRGGSAADMSVKWADLGITGKKKIRDLWKHRDVPWSAEAFSANVPSHGVALIRLGK